MPNCVQDGTRYRPNGAAETLRVLVGLNRLFLKLHLPLLVHTKRTIKLLVLRNPSSKLFLTCNLMLRGTYHVSLGLSSRRTNKLDVGCLSGARTQDTVINSHVLLPTELRGNTRVCFPVSSPKDTV